jgi:ankyrin repeat protein
LDSGADINAQDDEGKTALMYAIESENKYVAEYLLQQNADANIK